MRARLVVPLVLLGASLSSAQVYGPRVGVVTTRSGFGSVSNPGLVPGPASFGNVVFPGGAFRRGVVRGNISYGYGYNGYNPYYGGYNGIYGGRTQTVVVPFGVPVAVPVPAYQTPNVTVVMPEQPAPQVIINQTFVSDRDGQWREGEMVTNGAGMSSYQAPTPQQPDPSRRRANPQPEAAQPSVPQASTPAPAPEPERYYLFAYKTGRVDEVVGYAIQGVQLSYINARGGIQRIGLEQLDLEKTRQLNREQGLDVNLPE